MKTAATVAIIALMSLFSTASFACNDPAHQMLKEQQKMQRKALSEQHKAERKALKGSKNG